MSSGKRYKFAGTTFGVNTGTSSAKTITGITKADPAVVTSTAHGLANGTMGLIAAVVGMTELNGKICIVDNTDTNDFELAGVDSSAYEAYVSGGTFTPLTFGNFCELTGIDQQDGTTDEIEVTTICSTSKEFEQGLSDAGTVTLNYNYAPNEDVQSVFRAAKKSGVEVALRVVLPKSGGTILLIGTVQQSSFNGAVGAVWTGSTSLKLTNDPVVLPA